jgi:hypothetical protein
MPSPHAVRRRFVRRFSSLRLFDLVCARGALWRVDVPSYPEREQQEKLSRTVVGYEQAPRSAQRYWRALRVDLCTDPTDPTVTLEPVKSRIHAVVELEHAHAVERSAFRS